MAEEDLDKTTFLKILTRTMANNACTADAVSIQNPVLFELVLLTTFPHVHTCITLSNMEHFIMKCG